MIELTAENFHQTVQATSRLACLMYRGQAAGGDSGPAARAAAIQAHHDKNLLLWTCIDLDAAPEVAASFGIADPAPRLLVMKDRIVLHLAPLDQQDAAATAELMTKAMGVDIAAARQTIAAQKAAQSHLFARAVCPTAHRSRG